MAVMFCRNCGAQLKEGSSFCGFCGTAVTTEVPTPVDPAVETVPAPVQTETFFLEEKDLNPAPVPEMAPAAKPVQKQTHRSVGKTMLAILLCILIFLFSTVTLTLLGLRSATTEEKMEACIDALLDNLDLDELPAEGLISGATDADGSVLDWIVAIAEENNLELKKRDVEKLIESDLIRNLFSTLPRYVEDIRNGTNYAAIDEDTVRDMLYENRDEISDTIHFNMLDQDLDYLMENIEDSGILDFTSARDLKRNLPAVYYGIQYGLSLWVIGALCLLVLAWIVLLAKVNNWGITRTTGDLGITWTVTGVLALLPSVLATLLVDSLVRTAPVLSLLSEPITELMKGGILYSLTVLLAGILLISISAIIKQVSKKRMAAV